MLSNEEFQALSDVMTVKFKLHLSEKVLKEMYDKMYIFISSLRRCHTV